MVWIILIVIFVISIGICLSEPCHSGEKYKDGEGIK